MNNHCKNCYKLAEKLKQKERECEGLKEQNRIVITLNQETYEKFRNSELAVKSRDRIIEKKQKELSCYIKALEEIETLAQRKKGCLFECKSMEKILDIINKAKGEG